MGSDGQPLIDPSACITPSSIFAVISVAAFPMSTVSWATFRDANPDGLVLSRETGFRRDYGRNPYPGYDDVDGVPFLFEGEIDGRYTALTRIVGVESDEAAVGSGFIPPLAPGDYTFLIQQTGGAPIDYTFTFTTTSVPAPATLLLMGLGLVALRRRSSP